MIALTTWEISLHKQNMKNIRTENLETVEEMFMCKKAQGLNILCVVMCILVCILGCKSKGGLNVVDNESSVDTKSNNVRSKDDPIMEYTIPIQKENSDADEKTQSDQVIEIDLEPSEDFEFESNGDGTCTITGIGTCTDKNIVIPAESPSGDTVTLIGEYALYSLENVDSITLVNYNYEIDKNAFQYGEFTMVNIIGGSPVIKKSAFSSCEDLISISFSDCNIQADEYAFYSCGKNADVTFSNCTGIIEENAFQYGDFLSLTINNCKLKIEKSAFSSCEDLTSIVFTDSILETEEYAFYSCGDMAKVEITNCSLIFDDRTFQYSSLESLTITGSKVDMGDSVFSSCEDLVTVSIDCDSVILGEYAFYSCEDLINVTICDNSESDNEIKIDDRAFQYCKELKTVAIGNGNIEIGEYVFSGCADSLEITVAGKNYTADAIKSGLK